MAESIIFSLQVYFLTFCVAFAIAAMIKGLLVLMKKFEKKENLPEGKVAKIDKPKGTTTTEKPKEAVAEKPKEAVTEQTKEKSE